MKNKKPVILAIIVLIVGILIALGIKTLNNKGVFDKIITPGEQKYLCTMVSESKTETETLSITYNNGSPTRIVDKLEVSYKDADKDTINEITDMVLFGADELNLIEGYRVSGESDGETAQRIIEIDYKKLQTEATGLYAKQSETLDDYLIRLEKAGYTCEKNKN